MKKIAAMQNLAWLYAAMFFVIGSLRYIPFINDAQGYTLGIFKLEWYEDLLHYASGVWAAIAAWKSFKASEFSSCLASFMAWMESWVSSSVRVIWM